jgi:broad specificity phosphatase PhoE
VRHGESVGNVAAAVAAAAGHDTIEITERDADVGLSPLGRQQAEALGTWLASVPDEDRPTCALSSPYVRAKQTATSALEACGGTTGRLPVRIDERLRDRELGVFDRLTQQGVAHRYPEQAAARLRLGKFYHRPPDGESWADVALRLRSMLLTLRIDYPGERVIVFTHDLVVMLFRYLLEDLDEKSVLALGRETRIVNGGLTMYQAGGAGLRLRQFNQVVGQPEQIGGEKRTRPTDD